MGETFYMIRIPLRDPLYFQKFLRAERLPPWPADEGYGLHCLLGRLFADSAPKPFAEYKQDRGSVSVLAYADAPAEALVEQAKGFATPEAWETVEWKGVASKPMPTSWSADAQYGFEVRVCPVVRGPQAGPCRKGAEVDVFLARAWAAPQTPFEREQVYREWLADALTRNGGASLQSARMKAYRRVRLLRRDRKRKGAAIERPEARFQGVLRVKDPERFGELVRRGLGRHRAFGFGMLLLRPA